MEGNIQNVKLYILIVKRILHQWWKDINIVKIFHIFCLLTAIYDSMFCLYSWSTFGQNINLKIFRSCWLCKEMPTNSGVSCEVYKYKFEDYRQCIILVYLIWFSEWCDMRQQITLYLLIVFLFYSEQEMFPEIQWLISLRIWDLYL